MSDTDYESVQKPIKTMLLADRNAVIEECARVAGNRLVYPVEGAKISEAIRKLKTVK